MDHLSVYSMFIKAHITNLVKLLDPKTILYVCMVVLVTLWIYWLFCVPFVWIKYLDDVSYSKVSKREDFCRNNNKRDAINRIRKAKKNSSNEMPPPFPNGWYAILESSKVRPGEAKFVACLGEKLVVYRTQKHKVFILDAYCPHLGANLGVGGRVVGDNIECPFHQWSFRGEDGSCNNIPYSTSIPRGTNVKKWISQEVNDFIFIWYHAESTDPWELPVTMEIQEKKTSYHGRNEFYINCHIQEIPENGADMAHFSAIHSESFLAGSLAPSKSLLGLFGCHKWNARWLPGTGEEKHVAEITLTHSLQIIRKVHCFLMNVFVKQIGPSFVYLKMNSSTFGQIQVLQTITPIEPLLQKVVHRFYGPRWLGPLLKVLICAESFERDINMWNHKVFRRNPILAKEDSSIKQFRMWYSQFYTSSSKQFSEVSNDGW
ncbi:cholesterol 7-desaturase isoform X2 [Drosophila subobscura]|uniref:cholesterol 7-desaturase isoform X2 n=1 Tax=Drosophila subobscura TaxID=7241 RepID=UPI00155B0DEB|nr:cholesterol 7-desaturase isoform X2 [Drosophila subobscura]